MTSEATVNLRVIGRGALPLSEPPPLSEFVEALHRVRTGQGIKRHIRP